MFRKPDEIDSVDWFGKLMLRTIGVMASVAFVIVALS